MQRTRRPIRITRPSHRRSGLTTPAVAIAFLVVMTGLALIIDRIWLETAKFELRTAAEAAALAAGGELADDNLLLANAAVEIRLNNARQTASWIAGQNYVCGKGVELETEEEGDIRFGQLVQDKNGIQFQESADSPTTVIVTALRTRQRGNPVPLLISSASGLLSGEVAVRAEATIDNDVVGLRPREGATIPALPIAIWQNDPKEKRSDTWDNSIEKKLGTDDYSFDPESHTVTSDPDGIPEMTLHSMRTGGKTTDPNILLLDIGTGLNDTEIDRQFESGISVADLETQNGEIWIGQGTTVQWTSTPDLTSAQLASFQSMIGERRICFLYSSSAPQEKSPLATATCSEIVAIRIMAVNPHSDGSCDVVIQPTVMTSRTAILANESQIAETNVSQNSIPPSSASNSVPMTAANRYLYKLRLTH